MADFACNDNAFGPMASVNCWRGLDFTLFFEHVVLSILPSIALLACLPLRIHHLLRQGRKARPIRRHDLKPVSTPE
jgi:hypothetical protein